VDVILLGEEPGLTEAARELGVKHIPHVERNANGTPLISSMIELARENSSSDLLCIINADMVLMSDFLEAAKRAKMLRERFVLLSQRWDLDITMPIEFSDSWQNRLSSMAHRRGSLHRPAGSDFFLFPRSCYTNVPDFTIGRAGWDNWMIYKARREGWPVIDCTPSVMIVHQNHDYSHLPGGKPHYEHGGQASIRYTILDATHQLRNGKLVRPKMTSARFTRKVELFLRSIFFFLPENMLESIARPKRWKKRVKKLFR
jgi:hypothetical protein